MQKICQRKGGVKRDMHVDKRQQRCDMLSFYHLSGMVKKVGLAELGARKCLARELSESCARSAGHIQKSNSLKIIRQP